MSSVRLSTLIESVSSWFPRRIENELITYLDLSSIDNKAKVIKSITKVYSQDAPSRARQLVRTGDVLVSTVRPNLNSVSIVPAGLEGATASTGFTVLRPKPSLDSQFLFHFVRTPTFIEFLTKRASGSSYPAVSDSIVKSCFIEVPDLESQRMTAVRLDLADEIIRKYSQELSEVNQIQDSFCYSIQQSEHLEYISIGAAAKVITGKTPPTKRTELFEGGIPFVTPGDLESHRPVARSLSIEGANLSRTVEAGATLLCCIGTIGKSSIAEKHVAFNQQINAIVWSERVNPIYGYFALRALKNTLIAAGSSTTLPMLTKTKLEQILIPVPERALQDGFSDKIELSFEIEGNIREAISKAKALYGSIQQQEFGE